MSAIFISHSSKDKAEAAAMGAWLEDQGHKSYFIDYDGIRAGTDWEQVLYQRMRQCHAVVALVSPDWIESRWCFSEMIQAREKGKPIFPIKVKPCELPGLLSDTQSIDLNANPADGYRRLALGLKERGLEPTDAWDPERPPYPGLPCFQEADAAVFFGRSAEILDLRETLQGLRRHNRDVQRFVLILGSSGSGKSSLVRAGLIPSLKKDKENWLPIRPFRPQDEPDPIDALAFAIADTYKELHLSCDSDLLRDRLNYARSSCGVGSRELSVIAREFSFAAGRRDATVIITVDQTEELFGPAAPEPGKSFLGFLGASLSASDRHLMALATLRSDFLGAFQNQVALQEEEIRLGLNHVPWTVDPIPIERYADLIEGPARRAGLVLEDNLILKLIKDAGQPDSLPLLAFILRRLYDRHFGSPQADRQTTFGLRDYDQLGGLAGAVQNAADRILKDPNITEDTISQLRRAFIPGLVRANDEGSYSRRRAFLDELPPGSLSLLEKFVQARLLVKDKDGRTTVEIAHEALLRTWPTLSAWLGADRDKLRQHNFIIRAAKEWNEKDRSDDYLVHRDGRLTDARELISEHRFAFPAGSVERDYLDACKANQLAREAAAKVERDRRVKDAERIARAEAERAKEAERVAETERQRAEVERKALRRQRGFSFALAGLLLIAGLVAGIAVWEWNSARAADQRTRTAASQANLSLARRSQEAGNDAQALAHLAQALRLDPKNERAGALTAAMLNEANWAVLMAGPMGHDSAIVSAVFSPDGQQVLTASYDETARVWDAATGKALGEPMKHENGLNSAQFSPDGRRVVTASADKTARVWDAATGKTLGEPMKHQGAVTSARFSPDGQLVVTASRDHTARVWDAATGKPLGEPMKHENEILSAQFSPDGQRVVTASFDGTARVWDTATGKALGEPMKHEGEVYSAQFSPDGQRVVTASFDLRANLGRAQVWDAATGKALRESMKHESEVRSAQFSPDGLRVVTASFDGTARVWDAVTGKAISKPMKHRGFVSSAQFSPDGLRVVTASYDGTARVWDATTGEALGEPMKHEDVILSAQFSPNGLRVVTASSDHTARVWDAATERALDEPMKHESGVNSAQFSPDGQRVVTASMDRTAQVWDAATGKALGKPMKHQGDVTSAQFSPDGKRVVTASMDQTARVWDAVSGNALGEPMKHESGLNSAQFSPDGKRVVTASRDHTARVWDAATGKALGEPMKHESGLNSAQFSPDGKRVLTASWDHTARVWDAATGKALGEPMKHQGGVNSAQFSPDGLRVVTASMDRTARVWDAATGKALGEPIKHEHEVYSAHFSPDGQRLVTASRDQTARVYDAATGKALGEPMKHRALARVSSAQFSPDGQRVLTASSDHTARVWDVPTTRKQDTRDDVLLLADLAEAACGSVLQASDQVEILKLLPSNKVRATREKIAAMFERQFSELTPVERLLKWSVSDPGQRTISPFSKLTVPEWIENRITEGTLDGLRTAVQVDPLNARLAAHYGRRLADYAMAKDTDPDGGRRARVDADFQMRRALKLAPGDEEIKKLRSEVTKQLSRAVLVDHRAIEVTSREQLRVRAQTQKRLGDSLYKQGIQTEDAKATELLNQAVAAYRSALEIYTRKELPVEWAQTQNGLGAAFCALGTRSAEDGCKLLRDVVTAYRSALVETTKADLPKDWALTQINLGVALYALGTRSGAEEGRKLLTDSVAAYRSALEVFTKAELPQDWAQTQNNLGAALGELGTRSGAEEGRKLLTDSVAAYRSALQVLTRADLPQDWARTQNNLSVALWALGSLLEGEEGLRRKREAVELLRDLMSYQPDDLSRYRLASALGGFAFMLILDGQFKEAQTQCEEAQRLAKEVGDGVQKMDRDGLIFIQGNLAHALLFQGRYDEALAIYLQYWGNPLNGKTFGEITLEDFAAFDKVGLTHSDLSRMKRALDNLRLEAPGP